MKFKMPLCLLGAFFALLMIAGCASSRSGDIEEEPCESSGSGLIDPCDDIDSIGDVTGKPVIYLYPKEETRVTVGVDYQGEIEVEYPAAENHQWEVVAAPSGQLTLGERVYPYLFWEGMPDFNPSSSMEEGFVVAQGSLPTFLEEKLTLLGLNSMEQTDFITYWWPKLQSYPWVYVRFDAEYYEELATLTVTPNPDQVIRVFAVFKGLEAPLSVQEQSLVGVSREEGFVVVDWGGTQLR